MKILRNIIPVILTMFAGVLFLVWFGLNQFDSPIIQRINARLFNLLFKLEVVV